MEWDVCDVEVVGEFQLKVRFRDGLEGAVRFERSYFRGVFSHLIEEASFAEVAVANGAVTWPGELDLAPDAMYDEIAAHGEFVLS